MEVRIDEKNDGKTILSLTRGELGFSSAFLKKLKFSEGGILVNGESATVRRVLHTGDLLTLAADDAPEDVSPYILPAPLPLRVLYEDEALTVIDKPPDMPSHPSLGHKTDTVANALAYRYRGRAYVFRPVNRLDRDTSGVMLTANTRLAACRMFHAMQNGEIQKRYIAVADGLPPAREGFIDGAIRRTADSIITREACAPDAPGAQRALTEYRTIASGAGHSVLLCIPHTGRTHQIRVQLASVGCPLAGDTLYGAPSAHIDRHALHALTTEFPHPADGRRMTVRAPLPADVRILIGALFPSCAEEIFEEIAAI